MSEAAYAREPAAFGVTRSFSGRAWHLRQADDALARRLELAGGIPPVLARVLAARGARPDDLEDLLRPTLKRLLPEPCTLLEMDRAVARFIRALAERERIAVFGDYDVDGSSSAALLCGYLRSLGHDPILYVPDRLTEGYGPSPAALTGLRAAGAALAITADCGAAAHEAIEAANACGLDVIVLDHHAVDERGSAFAHVNPNRAGDKSGLGHLCAAGIVFLFLVAANRALRDAGVLAPDTEPDLMAALDLVGLATVCDVVPLTGVNRAFVRAGLARLADLERPGLRALAEVAQVGGPYTPYHLGFVFGPRINAGGRVGRCSLGAELLLAGDVERAMPLAHELDRHNRERQAIERMMLDSAHAMAVEQADSPHIFVHAPGWHPGVVGIVAGRLKDRHAKPAFVMGVENGMGRGSARSVAGIDVGALIRAARDEGLVSAGGGHAMAAGFSLAEDRIAAFSEYLRACLEPGRETIARANALDIDALATTAGANAALAETIAAAGPFGAGNPEPIIAVPGARVAYADIVGREHIRLRLAGGNGPALGAIAFRAAGTPLGDALLHARGSTIHAAGRLCSDRYRGSSGAQLQLEDAAPATA